MNQRFLAELLHRAAPIEMPPSHRRRAVLRLAAALAASAMLAPAASLRAQAQPRFSAYPFTLGVASGSPRPNGVVLWTRLAPEPFTDGGMPPEPVELRWQVARDRQFRDIAQQGVVRAMPDTAHSARVEVSGLEPSRWYWYRFMAGDAMSPVGRTRTAPAQNAALER